MASVLRGEIGAFLARHASDPDTVFAAELTVSELVMNAVEHAGGSIWVSLDWDDVRPVLAVHDLGPLFALDLSVPEQAAVGGRGLWLVSRMAADLAVHAKRAGGKRVSATLPVERRSEPSFDPPARAADPVPAMAEAGPDGFGKDAFLRALVVELSRTAEEIHGPGPAQELVAHVGATVGGQMETEYRAAMAVVGRLTTAQIADCYLRLKAAIGGGFYVIEVSDDRIVLGNTQCPFGEAVHRSPALCRMTSSVFGGIAARNRGDAVVRLDERIAVGDPECRVTVLLGAAATDARGHRYRHDAPAAPLEVRS
jgi:anti-sigma regulatory factor (Ser/Thr protein kinase)